eukprot:6097657-Amphidinium_carterae.1
MREAIVKNDPPPAFQTWMDTQREVVSSSIAVFTAAAIDFLKMLLSHDVAERPTADKALELRYLEQVDSLEAREVPNHFVSQPKITLCSFKLPSCFKRWWWSNGSSQCCVELSSVALFNA